ncbi:hypothetical protein Bbelb_093300 [Branchiostoma belcheri]|nr:hypothetical protein Bbelb_093300 [Branchiostoma belcheri]
MLSPTGPPRKLFNLLDSFDSVTAADPSLSHGERVRLLADRLAGASGGTGTESDDGPDKEVEDLLKQAPPPRVMSERGDDASSPYDSSSRLTNRTTSCAETSTQTGQDDVLISDLINRLDLSVADDDCGSRQGGASRNVSATTRAEIEKD